jgi:hypothetical protein
MILLDALQRLLRIPRGAVWYTLFEGSSSLKDLVSAVIVMSSVDKSSPKAIEQTV